MAAIVAMSTLPAEFTLQVPSAVPGKDYDTKTVKNWCATARAPAPACVVHAALRTA